MGLRCSLLGHAYGDTEVERSRSERGNEVVVTVREFRTCARCGATRVLSENTEVTAAEDARRASGGDQGAGGSPPAGDAGGAVGGAGAAVDRPDPPTTDDGVILEGGPADGSDDSRARGEWPDHDRPGREGDDAPMPWPDPPNEGGDDDLPDLDPGGWPDATGDDEGFDAAPAGDDVDAGVEFGGGLAPERRGGTEIEPTDDAEIIEPSGGSSGGFSGATASRGRRRRGGDLPPDVETEFVCPECGYARHSGGSSLRAGDVCPECRGGYLEEREATGGR